MRSTLDLLPVLELQPLRSIEDKVGVQQHLRDSDKSIENGSDLRGFTSASMIIGEDIANSMHPQTTYHCKYMLDTVITRLPHIKSNAHELWWTACRAWVKALSYNKFIECAPTCSRCNSLEMSIRQLLMPWNGHGWLTVHNPLMPMVVVRWIGLRGSTDIMLDL